MLLRDFHSPNIIWREEKAGIQKIGIIDFQDTVLGPPAYDLVSLLQDARLDVPEQLELAVSQALEVVSLRKENERLRNEVMSFRNEREIIGDSPAMHRVLQTVTTAAPGVPTA